MALKKSELYSILWKSCDELRGGMDASQYKDYVLVLLFMKYVSDKYKGKDDIIEVPEGTELGKGGSFQDMIYWKGKPEIGDEINKIIRRFAEGNNLAGIITIADFNDSDKLGRGKDKVDRLTKLISLFDRPELDLSKNRADGDDIMGDAYEYLMRHFATESGKSKGQFYTPSEVSRILAKVVGINKSHSQDQTIYDPTCGSGSLLLKAADEAPHGITIYGQEKDNATRALAVMNMWLHGDPTAEIWQDNTLSAPYFKNKDGSLQTFDFAVANPPFSDKGWTSGVDVDNDEFQRFDGYGAPPSKNGDFAYLLHIIRSLKRNGKATVILPHGVLFRGNAESGIRKALIQRGYIKGIIGLPANLFYGTGIPACIIIIDKEAADKRSNIFMIDASKGFVKEGNKNRLRERDLHKVVDVFEKGVEVPGYSRNVSVDEIKANDYNLNIPRYIDSQEEEDIQDIDAHLRGGIPDADIEKLNEYWKVCPTLRQELFGEGNRPKYSSLKMDKEEVKNIIFSHPEFVQFRQTIDQVFENWREEHRPFLKALDKDLKPKEAIYTISEKLLADYTGKPLIDKYDVYQHLMTYWEQTMKDDCYLISENGWKAETYAIKDDKGKYKGWGCDLLPKDLITAHYFATEQQAIQQLEEQKDNLSREKEELEEEHGGEEGLLSEVTNDKGSITKGDVSKRIKLLRAETKGKKKTPQLALSLAAEPETVYQNGEEEDEAEQELAILTRWLELNNETSATNKKIKEADAALDKKLYAQYQKLTEAETKNLVVDEKWMSTLSHEVGTELDRISQQLAQRIRELAERYDAPLPQQLRDAEALESRVNAHLEKMGFSWT